MVFAWPWVGSDTSFSTAYRTRHWQSRRRDRGHGRSADLTTKSCVNADGKRSTHSTAWIVFDFSEIALRGRGKCVAEKIRIAQQLRAETTLSLKRVAERLSMGTWTNVSSFLYKATKQ